MCAAIAARQHLGGHLLRHAFKIVAVAGALSLLAVGCGRPADTKGSTATGGKKLIACMVLDTGGVDDHSFNQSSWAGMQQANKDNPNIKISYVASNSQNDYEPNLTNETNKGCDTVIAVGGLMATAVAKVAKANPDQQYAEIDAGSAAENVYGLQYNTAQGGFLGGYLAAAMTKTGKVATFGGLNIPPVTIYMDGFWEGVQYYNKQKGRRSRSSAGTRTSRRQARSPTRSPTRTRASRSARPSSSRVRTSSSPSQVAPASVPALPRRGPVARSA
jgi:basic membrane protein A